MTKSEYVDKYYNTDNYLLHNLIEDVWNDARSEILKDVNEILDDQERLFGKDLILFRNTRKKVKCVICKSELL